MPELPEVEAVARSLRPLVRDQRIRRAYVFHPIATRPQAPADLIALSEERRLKTISRCGKYLFLELDRGLIELHFRLDGQLTWFSSTKELFERANRKPMGVHVDVAFEFGWGVLGFSDGRHFGRVHAWESADACLPLANLGVDAMSRKFTSRRLRTMLAASKRPVKEFLLDQTRVAGIGNIYSCEALWHAGLDPRRPANSFHERESAKLHKAIVSVLRRALECCLDPAPDFRDPKWWFQGLERILRVYQREAMPCRRCGCLIQRIEQGGRSTYCCLACQK
ncbi:MAG TPA: bifunctional DNA-formamidopyrimidine glycosylase/DNA-(apurinic or apyrimidinic site) lyase [Candidatus Limnocylindrales bacterium]|nr:bifunctional DNA-formamidopyrimidine glycosylase/DNA-(apurinic or apyrimidinic site) lyase [Candidatus Limnocylindrales bacterium]